jgi:uncharacterized protein YgiM (DUF1202 family)
MKYAIILATMISTSVMAQTDTNSAPVMTPVPAPTAPVVMPPPEPSATTTNKVKPAKKAVAKKKAAKPAAPLPPMVPFGENEPATAKQNNINVRAQSHINSEVITKLKQGDAVTVLKQVTLSKPKTDEPANWAQILLPAGTHVWVNSSFLDATNQTVKPSKLNIRSGPGENFSVVGQLHKGDAVKIGDTKGDWTSIDAPTNAFGFVAAHLLAHKDATPVAPPVVATVAPPPVTSTVDNPGTIAPPPTEPPATMTSNTPPVVPDVVTPPIPAPLPPPVVDEPPAPRIVTREGIVGGTVSIQAPSHFELESLDNGNVIDYLYTTSTNLSLKRYKGLTVLVTGEEELDERWPNTPVITIQKIQPVK